MASRSYWSTKEEEALLEAYKEYYKLVPRPRGKVEDWVLSKYSKQFDGRSADALLNKWKKLKSKTGDLIGKVSEVEGLVRPGFQSKDVVLVNAIKDFYLQDPRPRGGFESWVKDSRGAELGGLTLSAISRRWKSIKAGKTRAGKDYLKQQVDEIESIKLQSPANGEETFEKNPLWTPEEEKRLLNYAKENLQNGKMSWKKLDLSGFPGRTLKAVRLHWDTKKGHEAPEQREDSKNTSPTPQESAGRDGLCRRAPKPSTKAVTVPTTPYQAQPQGRSDSIHSYFHQVAHDPAPMRAQSESGRAISTGPLFSNSSGKPDDIQVLDSGNSYQQHFTSAQSHLQVLRNTSFSTPSLGHTGLHPPRFNEIPSLNQSSPWKDNAIDLHLSDILVSDEGYGIPLDPHLVYDQASNSQQASAYSTSTISKVREAVSPLFTASTSAWVTLVGFNPPSSR